MSSSRREQALVRDLKACQAFIEDAEWTMLVTVVTAALLRLLGSAGRIAGER